MRTRAFRSTIVGLLAAAAALAAFPEDADTPTEGWKYGFRSVIDRTQYPNAQDKEGASGMSLEAAWKDIAHWPRLPSSGGDFSSEGRPDVVVGYIEGGVNYWRNGADQLIKKIYINRAEVMANPTCAARYQDNGDPWFNVLDFPGTPDHNGNGRLDPEDLIIECANGVDDDGNGYTDDISGWDFYNRQNNPHSQDVTYGHHNGQMLNGEAAINDGGTLGACPLCMVMPIRAGAEALDRTDDLAQAFLFAADSGVASIASLTADLGYSTFMRPAVERGFISSALSGPEIVQLLIATASDIDPSDYTSVPNAWPTQVGWDLQTGYGRINARRFQEELRVGHIRPVAWFDGPEWFTLYDPTVQSKVEIFGHTEGRRSPGGSYGWTLEWALGAEPADAAFTTLASGTRQAAFDGKLGELDLSQVPASFYARAFALSTGKQLETAENYTVTLRLRVSYTAADTSVLTGEERRSIFVHHDPDWPAGFPRRIRNGAACAGGQIAPGAAGDYCFSPGGEGQPALADVAGIGRLQIVFGDTDGYVHAVDPSTGAEVPGFPVTADPTVVMKSGGWPGVNPGFEPVPIPVAVGDLDHDGHLGSS